jgi:xylulokinase
MTLVAGVDSSTQSTKVEIRDLATGRVVGSGTAPHPTVTPPVSEQDPASWWSAFESAYGSALAEAGAGAVDAISVGGQQHGMVALDRDDQPVHPAKLWNDTESAPDAGWLIGQLGGGPAGRAAWAAATGSVPVAAFTVTKLSWLHRTHPEAWARVARILLPHDYLTYKLTGRFVTDRGDASGTGYWSPTTGAYLDDVLALIDRHRDWSSVLPTVLGPFEAAGTFAGATVGPGTGDNMAAALGVGLTTGDAVVSAGTSGTAYAVCATPTVDPSGAVAGFADATGQFLPLVCTLNAARVLEAAAAILGTSLDGLSERALSARPGADRLIMLPYLEGERTPNRPDATASLHGLTGTNARPENLARAAVEGLLCGLADGLDAIRAAGIGVQRVLLIGGGARSEAVRRIAPTVFGVPVEVPEAAEYVADGAARQAAWVLAGGPAPPDWRLTAARRYESDPEPAVRERYAAVRDA